MTMTEADLQLLLIKMLNTHSRELIMLKETIVESIKNSSDPSEIYRLQKRLEQTKIIISTNQDYTMQIDAEKRLHIVKSE